MWLEQCFIVNDLGNWIKDEVLLATKFLSVVDGKELIITFAEKDSLVLRLCGRNCA